MGNLFLEIGAEDIPAKLQRQAASEFEDRVRQALADAGLEFGATKSYSAPRRLILTVAEVSDMTPPIRTERKGPRVGAPEKALDGFMRSAGLQSLDEAEIVSDAKKGDYYRMEVEKPGRPATEVLAEILPAVIADMPFPKTMAWDDSGMKWIRPIRWIVALLDREVIDFRVGNVQSCNQTKGHQHLYNDWIEVDDFEDYADEMEAHGVVFDPVERKQIILDGIQDQTEEFGLTMIEDAGLMDEIVGLVEYPVVLMGEFDPKFLHLPDTVIHTVIRECQRNPMLVDKDGNLSNKFIIVANVPCSDGGDSVIRGNEAVVKARLSDAEYFWEHDTAMNFSSMQNELSEVVYYDDLGSMLDKVNRIQHTAVHLIGLLSEEDLLSQTSVAALYCKNDLVTRIVEEFPSMQGKAGKLLALHKTNPLPDDVATAIEEHYWPLGHDRYVPTNPVSVALALADRMDRLVCFYGIGRKPKGNSDPYSLRRAAIDILRIVRENLLELDLQKLAERAAALNECINYRRDQEGTVVNTLMTQIRETDESRTVAAEVMELIEDKLRVMLKDEGFRYDVIDAVMSERVDVGFNLKSILMRMAEIRKHADSDDFNAMLDGLKRIFNILGTDGHDGKKVKPSLFETDAERKLWEAVKQMRPRCTAAADKDDLTGFFWLFAELKPFIDDFFDNAMVNCDDEQVKANRRRLLGAVMDKSLQVADFDLIVRPGEAA